MGEIRLLPDNLINKIAAGEVVERPASVVKELVENALDAGATSVTVVLEEGGRRLVQVEDDGRGMPREDALMALERHATSKLYGEEDLEKIRFLGFRGEALPSIASVSRLLLKTRSAESDSGVQVRIEGGEVVDVRDLGYPRGTSVSVADLFYNVPARRKFLRTPGTELSHASAVITRTALAHSGVSFELRHDGRQLLQWPAVASLRDRLHQVFGEERIGQLLEFDQQLGGGQVRIAGVLSPVDPTSTRRKNAASLIFVNNRPVSDRKVIQAVRVAYRDFSVTGVNPFYVLFLALPPEEVDVNVHPTKNEVRFRNPGAVFQAVSRAVRQALQGTAGRPVTDGGRASSSESAAPHGWTAPPAAEPLPLLGARRPVFGQRTYTSQSHPDWSAPAVHEPGPQPLVPTDVAPGRWRLLGQLHNSYLLVEDADGLLVVDQHVAHERVLYERYLAGLHEDDITVQGLLVPAVIETDPPSAAILEPLLPQLAELGIELEHFGGSTFLHKGHPDFLEQFEVQPFLEEVVAAVRDRDRTTGQLAREIRQGLLISAACHAAIKVNMPLGREKMEQLLSDLLETENPLYCPHGRPIVLRIPQAAIEKSFLRT